MVASVAAALASHHRLEPVAELQAALSQTRAV
jgi:hypothetical protein